MTIETRLRLRADYRVKYKGKWSSRLLPVLLLEPGPTGRALVVKNFYLQKLRGQSVIFAELERYVP